jgi:subtilisin family serine protease
MTGHDVQSVAGGSISYDGRVRAAFTRPRTRVDPLDLVNLRPLMKLTSGRPEILVGLIDGPVATEVTYLASENIRAVTDSPQASCQSTGAACQHGTFIAAVLSARRSAPAPAICPDCTLLVRPIFLEASANEGDLMPRATPEELASAIVQSARADVHVLNLSLATAGHSARGERVLQQALDEAAKRGMLVVAAAGNQRHIGSSPITAHPWVIPVTAYGLTGRPLEFSGSGASIGKRGIGAAGEGVLGPMPDASQAEWAGTSVAAPFVTGTIALLWSQIPRASPGDVRFVVNQRGTRGGRSIVPPLLNAWRAYLSLQEISSRRQR